MKIHRKLSRAAVSALATLALAAASLVASTPANAEVASTPANAGVALANAAPCDFAVLIGVRGFTAPSGSGTSAGGYGWTSGGYGDVPQAVVNRYNTVWGEMATDYTYEISLNYDAGGVTPAHIWNGAERLANEIN